MQNGFKKSSILRSKIEKNLCRNVLKTHAFLDIVFSEILNGFGTGFGRVWEGFGSFCGTFFMTFFDIVGDFDKNSICEASWRGLGEVLGGFGEGFENDLGGSGNLLCVLGGCLSFFLLIFVAVGCFLMFFAFFCIFWDRFYVFLLLFAVFHSFLVIVCCFCFFCSFLLLYPC